MFYFQFPWSIGQVIKMRFLMIVSVFTLVVGAFDTSLISLWGVTSVSAKPLSLGISKVSAPYPKHCLDQRQWRNPQLFNPYNLFDGDAAHVWQLCEYAIKDQGYTVNFTLKQPIEVDGFVLAQVLKQRSPDAEKKGKARRRKRKADHRQEHGVGEQLKRFKRLQVIFYNREISPRYPFYFQEVKFDGEERVSVEYQEILAWNPILIGDSQFDERRRALGFEPAGIDPPVKVDRVGLVFWEYEGQGEPPALSEFTLTLKGKRYKVEDLVARKRSYGIRMGKIYDLLTRDYMFIGDERALIFSRSGTIWGIEGEEESAKVMGAWRFRDDRIEVDLSPLQRTRTSAKRRKRLSRQRKKSYQPLHLIVDEAPTRVYIIDSPLAGEYEMTRAPVPTEVLDDKQDELPPPFEAP